MARTITRKDFANSYETVFELKDDVTGISTEIRIPVWEANDVQTTIENASWTTIGNLFDLTGETIIKSE